jgi:hypothetical protein
MNRKEHPMTAAEHIMAIQRDCNPGKMDSHTALEFLGDIVSALEASIEALEDEMSEQDEEDGA